MASIGKRTKEIGVHKVFGADILQISALITRSFIVLVLFAILLKIPAVWYLASRWLESFPYRILINSWIFVAGGILTLLIAMLTMSVQTLKAANMNPATSLRSE